MERQPVPATLTDQAVVAIAVARATAAAAGRDPTVADLLLGLAAEPDGVAGRLLRRRESALAALGDRPLPPRLAPLAVARDWAVADARPRPAWTRDLLSAAVEAGGAELADLLAAVGVDRAEVTPWAGLGGNETVGLQAPGAGPPGLTLAASRVVARVRARAGGALDLVIALAEDPAAPPGLPDPETLAAVRAGLERGGTDGRWDAGLDAVLDAARRWRGGQDVDTADLVAAATVAGGEGPGRLLDEAAPS